jgi:hypothetical protein
MFMKLHENLMGSSRLYHWWHQLPFISILHFGVVLTVGTVLALTIQTQAQESILEEQVAQSITSASSVSIGQLTSRLLAAAKDYERASTDAERASSEQQIRQLITQRENLLAALAISNPRGAVLASLPAGIVKMLPEFMQSLLEEEVDLEGEFSVIHVDANPKSGTEYTRYELDTTIGGEMKRLHVRYSGEAPALVSGTKVKINGLKVRNELVPIDSAGGNSGTTVISQPSVSSATGPQKTLVILFKYTNSLGEPWSTADIANTVFNAPNSTNLFFQESSFGKVSLIGDVVGWYTIPYTNSGCNSMDFTWVAAAKQAAINAGVPVSTYTKIVYMNNSPADCSFGGWGYVGGVEAFVVGWYNVPTIFAHEYGHLLGARHAQSVGCSGTIGNLSTCSFSEYGDLSDVMGNSWNNYSQFVASRKFGETWHTSSNLQTVTTSGTYTITPTEVNDGAVKMLKIAKADTNQAYVLSYRQPLGFDAPINPAFTGGVNIHITDPALSLGLPTKLLNGPLTDGAVFTDSINNITIQQVSHSSAGVTVTVTMPTVISNCVPSASTMSIAPVSQGGSAGSSKSYSVSVRNNDGSACSSATYSLTQNVPAGWNSSLSVQSMTIPPGGNGSASLTVTSPAGTPDGTYPLSVQAVDPSTALHSASVSGSYVIFTDNVGPNVTITSPQNGATIKGSGNTNIRVTATDSSGIATITIAIDGTNKASCTNSTSCNYSLQGKSLTAGTHTITASSTDKAGNSSSKSITVTK